MTLKLQLLLPRIVDLTQSVIEIKSAITQEFAKSKLELWSVMIQNLRSVMKTLTAFPISVFIDMPKNIVHGKIPQDP